MLLVCSEAWLCTHPISQKSSCTSGVLLSDPIHDHSQTISCTSLEAGRDPLTIQRLNYVTSRNLETGQH